MLYCPRCGSEMHEGTIVCGSCGWQEVAPRVEDDPAMKMLLPVGRSPWAIAAGYFGLFSLIIFPAPIAIVLGAIALYDIKKHPEKGGRGRAVFGLVMGILFTLILVAALAAAAVS